MSSCEDSQESRSGPNLPRGEIDTKLVQAALFSIPPDVDHDTWVRIGMAVKAGLGEDGLELWEQWSRGGQTYRPADASTTWKSIRAEGKVTIGTLFALAKKYGFALPSSAAGRPVLVRSAK